uniref:UDP-glucose 4-epimerase n=1 Tax=Strigamia maritima TaxID=126957 RepID=T1J090_STRMM
MNSASNGQGQGHWILVTGGAGYVGSHTILELLNENYNVVVIDNCINAVKDGNVAKPESLKRIEKLTNKSLIFYEADLMNKKMITNIFKMHKIDSVIHFAALKAVGESVTIPLDYYKNNLCGTINLIETMKENDVKKIIFSSSATVYGTPEFLPLDETHPVGRGCSNPYGRSKYFIEEILRDITISDEDWSVLLLRYFNPVGAHCSGLIGEDPLGIPNNLMPYVAQVAVGRRPELQVFGGDYPTTDGTGVRDYIHVVDLAGGHVAGLKKMLNQNFRGCKAYNLGRGDGYSVLDVVNAFCKVSGKEIPYKIVGRRAGDVAVMYCNPSLAEKELEWKAEKTLEEMCKEISSSTIVDSLVY